MAGCRYYKKVFALTNFVASVFYRPFKIRSHNDVATSTWIYHTKRVENRYREPKFFHYHLELDMFCLENDYFPNDFSLKVAQNNNVFYFPLNLFCILGKSSGKDNPARSWFSISKGSNV